MAGGRPTKYKSEYAKQAGKLCLLGATNVELADFFEVTISTIHQWRVTHEEFSSALKENKEVADRRVEEALYHRALGYTHDQDDIRVVEGEIVITETKKHYPPDSTSMIFWLKNRQPDKWRDKQEIEQTSNVTHNIMPVPVANSVEEWEQASQETHDKNLNND